MRKIMFTGGGSAGHVTVNIALIPQFINDGWSVVYVGSENGIERQLIEAQNVRYIGIQSGKLRRYFDVKNFTDPFRVVKGIRQAFRVIKREQPDVLFSKGGFVSVPVVIGAWLNRVPTVIHESDVTPGLANRIATKFAHSICTTFKESERYLPAGKAHFVGPVVREELNNGDRSGGLAFFSFRQRKPILLVMGGSLGAKKINETLRSSLLQITDHYNVVHLCGKGNLDHHLTLNGYRQYEYLNEELPDAFAAADVVVSRAGANSIFELLHLRKPMLLIPLPLQQSRGDQLANAKSFEQSGFCKVLVEEQMTPDTLVCAIDDVNNNRQEVIDNMSALGQQDALSRVVDLIKQVALPRTRH